MKSNEKKAIVALFVLHRKEPKAKFKALVQVLLNLSYATQSQKRYYNASRYSPAVLSSLEYDIKKMCSISDSEINKAVKEAKKHVTKDETKGVMLIFPTELKLQLDALDVETADYIKELKPIAKALGEVYNKAPKSQSKIDLIAFINENFTKEPTTAEQLENLNVQIFTEASEEAKIGIKLRDRYPFLKEADCPDEFKILTADMLTAYDNFRDGRKELKALIAAGASNEDLFEIARKTVADFELDLEIGDELDYYLEHGKILGEHPIFADKMLAEKIDTMSTVELTKRQKNLRTYVSRDEKAFNKLEEGEDKIKFGEKLQAWKDELALVDGRLEKIS